MLNVALTFLNPLVFLSFICPSRKVLRCFSRGEQEPSLVTEHILHSVSLQQTLGAFSAFSIPFIAGQVPHPLLSDLWLSTYSHKTIKPSLSTAQGELFFLKLDLCIVSNPYISIYRCCLADVF